MPPARVDPDRLRSLGAALEALRECAGEAAEELLEHLPEVGDRETQAALDGWVEQVADLLRAVDATATDLAGGMRVASLAEHRPLADRQEGVRPVRPAEGVRS